MCGRAAAHAILQTFATRFLCGNIHSPHLPLGCAARPLNACALQMEVMAEDDAAVNTNASLASVLGVGNPDRVRDLPSPSSHA